MIHLVSSYLSTFTDTAVTVNATWTVRNMDLMELERQNQTQFSVHVDQIGQYVIAFIIQNTKYNDVGNDLLRNTASDQHCMYPSYTV